jgi:sugar lactone lactonase YvrE
MPGPNCAFNASVPGPGAYSYQWQFNGANLQNTNFIITTVAGTNRGGYSGDGGAAINAELYEPSTVALDVFGNLFITDMGNCRIRKVDTNGIITTVAGTNSQGYSGDGGAAISAKLNAPYGVAFDASGNLYFADNQNDRIRKVDTNGIITTVAGTNVWGYSGDGSAAVNATLDRPQGVAFDAASNLYFADTENARIRKVDTNGIITTVAGTNSPGHSGDGGAAISAQLDGPSAVALDPSGNLYVAETQNARIRKVDTNGIITTVAGTNSPGFSGDGGAAVNARLLWPTGVALDASGNQYIADQENNRIRKVAINGIITTVAGTNGSEFSGDGGVAVNAQLNWPAGVALDAAGNLYIADSGNNRIREVFFAGYPTLALTNVSVYNAGSYTVVITNLAGSVTSAVATLVVQAPPVITVQPAGQVVLAASSPVLSVAAIGSGPFGYLFYLAGTNLVQDGTNSTLTLAAVSATNAGNYTVVVTNAWGSATSQVASLAIVFPPSAPPGGLTVLAGTSASLGATVAGAGPFTFQWQFNGTNLPNNIITTVAGNGTWGYSGDGGPATNGSLDVPRGLAFDSAGNLYIADENNQRIRKVNTSGTISTVAGNGIYSYSGDGGQATNANIYDPIGVSLDASENLYFGDSKNNRVRKVDTSGIITTVAGGGTNGLASVGAATNASLYLPNGPVLDRAGNLYFPDFGNYVVRKVDTNGIITTVAGNGVNVFSGDGGQAVAAGICSPVGIALDANDNLYIASPGDQRVRKVDTNGIITTVAGNGNSTSTGDDGPATNASLNPYSVAVNAFGDLYIPDIGNCRIRKVDNNGIITTVAGNGTPTYAGDGGPATNASLNHPSCVTFDAAGNLFIGDQNNNRIRKVLLYAGYPTFTLSNVLAGDAGSYSVVVTTPYGSVTSAVVTLNVALTQPQILAGDGFCGFLANQFGFNLCGATGQTIVVDGSADLVNWTPLFTNTCADANPFYFCDPCWTNFPSRFYRARLP